MIRAIACPYFRRAFGWCVPIGGLGGLIGLGGGEFRLPVLMHGIGFDARSAMPLNLLISLVTLSFALAVRSAAVSLAAVVPYIPAMIGLLAGGMASAFVGVRLAGHLTDRRLIRLIAILLGMLGLLLMAEAFLPFESGDLLSASPMAQLMAGVSADRTETTPQRRHPALNRNRANPPHTPPLREKKRHKQKNPGRAPPTNPPPPAKQKTKRAILSPIFQKKAMRHFPVVNFIK